MVKKPIQPCHIYNTQVFNPVEFVEGILAQDVEHLVRVPVVQFIHVRLEVGVADVIVNLWADEQSPLLRRAQIAGALLFPPIQREFEIRQS